MLEDFKEDVFMFNKNLREDAIQNLKSEQERYELQNKRLVEDAEELFGIRVQFKRVIDDAWEFLNSLRNKPTQLDTELEEIKIQTNKFSGLIEGVEQEIEKANLATGGTAATGVAAGIGVAAFGPTAAMAIATTFGTASTGTAIASLSGAAATNAALAWLGGGALAVGGGGTAAGTAVLGLAGPIGWAIGGGALATAGLIKSGKNKKIAEKANRQAAEIHKYVKVIEGTREEIKEVISLSSKNMGLLSELVLKCQGFSHDYTRLSVEEKQRLGVLINNTKAAAKLLNRSIGANN
ncbi:DNA polymerase III subunits gamma and tau [Bacillus cereus Rock3-42]|nr:DNA polymerase III subunits gamma and tau [Bacillus cereus Rock3-42]